MAKSISIVVLLLALMWRPSSTFEILLQFVVCTGALAVVAQALRAGKFLWGVGFLTIAVLYNPVAPLALSRTAFLFVDLMCLGTFALALGALKTRPLLTVPSITNLRRRSESL
jgi:hypothetical protein